MATEENELKTYPVELKLGGQSFLRTAAEQSAI